MTEIVRCHLHSSGMDREVIEAYGSILCRGGGQRQKRCPKPRSHIVTTRETKWSGILYWSFILCRSIGWWETGVVVRVRSKGHNQQHTTDRHSWQKQHFTWSRLPTITCSWNLAPLSLVSASILGVESWPDATFIMSFKCLSVSLDTVVFYWCSL